MVNKKILQEGFRNWLLDTQTIKCGSCLIECSHRCDSHRYPHNFKIQKPPYGEWAVV